VTDPPPRQRADRLLVERGLFESRARAQAAIESGRVSANGVTLRKASDMLNADARIEATEAHPWVSRGGVKLAHALDHFGIDATDQTCLDIGASTGGFSDVLLARGAAHVDAIDVGRNQLHARLRNHPHARQDAACRRAHTCRD
jgi:23S rRNA (cytidine1920-2'-O)/16S rRNA (cytidine1409-2'-O)-methyltransferase